MTFDFDSEKSNVTTGSEKLP